MCSMPSHNWAKWWFFWFVFCTHGEYGLVPWGVGTILGNGYGIQGQNYVALLQGSEMSAGFHYRILTLDI